MQAALSLLRKIAEGLDDGKCVPVHSRQGVGRSGSIAAGVLVTSGIEVEKAMLALRTDPPAVSLTSRQMEEVHGTVMR